ncbi:hypothetical protein GGE46_003938 [Rhizobium etli]|uniref:Uncharacterized protein n=1 Tax=Rhizobium etli TaxID=29449 RepID=A0A7W6VDW8_RHIET|nr:hypothetical protein [Rhizobium etli]MBB4537045.1 hypothetical protein [Rhizobium etli]
MPHTRSHFYLRDIDATAWLEFAALRHYLLTR